MQALYQCRSAAVGDQAALGADGGVLDLYWRVLEEIAARDHMTLTQLLVKLHGELLEAHGRVDNFASFLRVCCGRYLMLQLTGDIPQDAATPIRGLDADAILARESRRMGQATPLPSVA
mgnify:CR=1 FL=1